MDNIILAFYSADIVIQFLTSYYNVTTGEGPITKPSMIAKRYAFSIEFVLDFLSTFPFSWFETNNEGYNAFAQLVQLLKVFRIRKMYSNITKADLTIETKALTKIAFFSFLLCVYTHIMGCVMWWVLKEDYLWVAPTDFWAVRSRMQDPTYNVPANQFQKIEDQRTDLEIFFFQWFSMWYHSALTLMLVEVTARSKM